MVFLSESSIREMVQEALGGGAYPTLDGDGNFPIVPSPLAEPIVTKLALQPVRVMRVPTDRHEFELALSELLDGVENDHLPSLFLKLRDVVSDFVPIEDQGTYSSSCPDDCSPKDDQMPKQPDDKQVEISALRTEVRRLVKTILKEEADSDDDGDDFLSKYRPGGDRFRPAPPRLAKTIGGLSAPLPKDDPLDGDDWDSDMGDAWGDDGAGEFDAGDNPHEKDTSYPMIGDDPEFDTWAALEREIASSAWEPGAELDKFRGRDMDSDWNEASGGDHSDTDVPTRQKDTISKVQMTLDDIQKDKDFEGMGIGTIHGMIAKAARKLGYVAQEISKKELDEVLDDSTDKYLNFLIKQGTQKDESGSPMLTSDELADLKIASGLATDNSGKTVKRPPGEEGKKLRKAIQELPMFREYLAAVIEEMMEEDGFAVSHKDAAKDKDKHSVIHRMKTTTR